MTGSLLSPDVRGRLGRSVGITVVLATLGAGATSVQAFSIDTGNQDISMRLDTSLRYNAGWRLGGQNDHFANHPSYHETEGTFDRGDMVLNRVDVMSQFDLVYQGRHGFRVSGSGWYDHVYRNGPEGNPAFGSGYNGDYRGNADRFHHGPSGELLDAFVFTGFDLGEASADFRIGQHNLFWGESLFNTSHGIAYAQGPLDGLKAASSPGSTAQELFLPVNQISAQLQLNYRWSFGAQYYLDWRGNRLPEGGTYFGSSDMLWKAPVHMNLGPVTAPRGHDYEGSKGGFGLFARWQPEFLRGSTVGLYYRKFDETQPWGPVFRTDEVSGDIEDFHLAHARDTELYGLSLATTMAGWSVGSEVIYRHNTALVSESNLSLAGDFRGREGARGNSLHFLLNGVYLMPKTPLWVTGSLQAEIVYSHLLDVTQNEEVFRHEDYACAADGRGKRDGCTTDDVVLVQIGFTPEWPNALPGTKLGMPISASYGVYGNGATLGGGNEGAYTWSVGVNATYRNRHKVALRYNQSYARYTHDGDLVQNVSGNAVQNDHNWLSLSLETSF